MVPARRIRQYIASGLGGWIVLTLTVLPEASALKMPDYDLTSLVLLSESIVLVERFESGGAWYRVKRVFKGKCQSGLEFTLPSLSSYTVAKDLSKKPWDSEMFLFVKDGAVPRSIVASGMKPVIEGRVYRFIQLSNPGMYELFPQGWELADPDTEKGEALLKLQDFEKDLNLAMARVARLERP